MRGLRERKQVGARRPGLRSQCCLLGLGCPGPGCLGPRVCPVPLGLARHPFWGSDRRLGPGLGGGPGGATVGMGFWCRQVGVGFLEEGRGPVGWGGLSRSAGWQPRCAWPGGFLFYRDRPRRPAAHEARPWDGRLVFAERRLSPGGQPGGGRGPARRPTPQLRFSPGASLPPRCRSPAGGRRGPCGWVGGRAHVPAGAGNRSPGCWRGWW